MLISALSLPLTIDAFYDIVLTLSQYYVDVIKKIFNCISRSLFTFFPDCYVFSRNSATDVKYYYWIVSATAQLAL